MLLLVDGEAELVGSHCGRCRQDVGQGAQEQQLKRITINAGVKIRAGVKALTAQTIAIILRLILRPNFYEFKLLTNLFNSSRPIMNCQRSHETKRINKRAFIF